VIFDFIVWKGGNLNRSDLLSEVESIGDGFSCISIPKAFGFEAATQPSGDNLQIQA